ncbi:prepilin peptidase [Acetobacterium sp. K1/6]|jgi:leader peptidase (prepilin peptidase)/N-methyltransferase|uniref:prepilin peptidase n=1 Tax=Acetobacterium sp. K1/6 TaxID=3055467 RepID=UPI002ACAE67C|nr:prepilin peptidase [Acetobacterium sp. K1/6]MDZ5726390.1 prepilin peptidase [Acetobacterium sp. K1/6]
MGALGFGGVLGCWFLMGSVLKRQFEKAFLSTAFIVATPLLFLLLVIDDPVIILRTGLFCCLMFYIGYFDFKTKTIPRFVHPLILLVGCIGISGEWLVKQAIPGALTLGILMAVSSWLIKRITRQDQAIGLGDVKLVTVCGFYLGWDAGVTGLMIGLLLSILWSRTRHLKRNEMFAFAPFLCSGFMIAVMLLERKVYL